MKKLVYILAIAAIALTACSKLESNEKKLVDNMLSDDYATANAALAEYINWLKADKATMTHDFNYSREKLGMKVITSPDGALRCYSWVTSKGDTISTYANITQWLMGDKMVGFSGPIDALLTGRKPNIKRQWSLAHSIDTIYEIPEASQPVYLIVESYVNEEGKSFSYISAAVNQGLRLQILPFFFDGIETAGNREYIDDGKVNKQDLIKWDDKAKRVYAYLTDDSCRVIPGKYDVYTLSKDRFVKTASEQ